MVTHIGSKGNDNICEEGKLIFTQWSLTIASLGQPTLKKQFSSVLKTAKYCVILNCNG